MKKVLITCLVTLFIFGVTVQIYNFLANEKSHRPLKSETVEPSRTNLFELQPASRHQKILRPTLHPFASAHHSEKIEMSLPEKVRGLLNKVFGLTSGSAVLRPSEDGFGNSPEAWVKTYGSGMGASADRTTAMAVDDSGFIYITGHSWTMQGGKDFLTVKYDSAGAQVWAIRFDSGNGDDVASDIEVDTAGNVYVAGWGAGADTYDDYVTIKYNASGMEQWVAHYNGPGNGDDYPSALAIDDSGNVYVTGESYGTGTHYDFATVKYDSAGIEQWVARYDGPANSWDEATALALDDSGNVYVTGTSRSSETAYDYATLKYSPSGNEQWVARYSGPDEYSWDAAEAIAIDDSGNVYVTGCIENPDTYYDFGTIKYNSAGIAQWAVTYNGIDNQDEAATALALDDSGNVYVTGNSAENLYYFTNCTIVTVKYNPSGNELWAVSFDDAESPDDVSTSIAINDSGDIFITGSSFYYETDIDFVTVKYNSIGAEQWVAKYNSQEDDTDLSVALGCDGAGNVYVTGYSTRSSNSGTYTTIKYSSLGIEQWIARYDEARNSYDQAVALAIDSSGNIYVTGSSQSTNSAYDYATIKYNPSGELQWVTRYNGAADGNDKVAAIAVDKCAQIYITGNSESEMNATDYATIKYNSDGLEQWCAHYNGPGNGHDQPAALAVDDFGNVYLTGKSRGANGDDDWATIKYNADGAEQWVDRYNGPANDDDYATALTIDDSGNVFVTGVSYGLDSYRDYATIKYDSAGTRQWIAVYPGMNAYSNDYAVAIALDDSGHVLVTGTSSNNFTTIKYNPAGAEQWIAHFDGTTSSYTYDYASALAIDDSGNVYVAGRSRANATYFDYVTVKYNSAGAEEWIARYCGPEDAYDEVVAMALDDSGNVYVTGNSQNAEDYNNYDYATVKYNSAGVEEWVHRFDRWNEKVAGLAIDDVNNVYLTGSSGLSGFTSVYLTIKYSHDQDPLPVELASFSANKKEGTIYLQWRTESENNAYGFHIEKSLNKQEFKTIGFVKSRGTTSKPQEYQFIDHDIAAGTYFYRLKQVDRDGSFEYSNTIEINITPPVTYALSQNYPNPFNPQTKIAFCLPAEEKVTLKIFNVQGQLIATLLNDVKEPGNHALTWDAADKPSGVYICQFQAGHFRKNIKLLLVK